MTIETDPRFWDCECPGKDYIHPKSFRYCPKCKTMPDDQPDSRVNELSAVGLITERELENNEST